jgi:hypothetical protein
MPRGITCAPSNDNTEVTLKSVGRRPWATLSIANVAFETFWLMKDLNIPLAMLA